jgi:hypothetical protein
MPPPSIIPTLVKRFADNRESYIASTYNEATLRQDYLNPFLEALGWDVRNKQGYSEAFKEVIIEERVKVGEANKAPDYSCRIGGRRIFFVEAKKPSVNIKDDAKAAYQLRRYAWSAKLPLSLLSSFDEFSVYDCRLKPDKNDKAGVGRILYFRYTDYAEKWEDIAAIFSRDAVLKGSFDRYAQGSRGKKGTSEVDDAFLEEIEKWRKLLAVNIAIRNPSLTTRQLNFAVQRTIDRIIFLRICEDRGIEEEFTLQEQLNGEGVYKRLCERFLIADKRYNSGLFHFTKETGREETPDSITLTLKIDDKTLKEIIGGLYFPDCPYAFSVLPADILGQVYEQFLGKVIRLTAGHQAKVEDKPEVKKAGGVFYTPTYIVDYIVKNTVGKLLENKTPEQAAALRILDPACGSGSFLIGAYQYLLDWHLKWYMDNKPLKWSKGENPVLYQIGAGGYRLTASERKRILTNNIYGVDIDTQAVEVTKLSLLLKVLEDENAEKIQTALRLFHERALPDLGNNIKCGNSLIGSDFYEGAQESLELYGDEEEKIKVNAFDWDGKDGFPEIMKAGGFDAVIGNPPYVPIESMTDVQRNYYQKQLPQLERKYDSSILFILSMLNKLNSAGLLGYISSLTWQTGENYVRLRKQILDHYGIVSIVNLPFDVFKNAYVDTGIYILSTNANKFYRIYRFPKKQPVSDLINIPFQIVPIDLIQAPDFKVILDPISAKILLRVRKNSKFVSLGDITTSTQGLAGNMYVLNPKPGKRLYPFLESGQVYRYILAIDNISYTDMTDKLSLCAFYDAKPKILIRRVINRQDRLMCAYTENSIVFKKDVNPFILHSGDKKQTLFLTGILNSKIISFLYINTSSIATKDDFRQTTLAELRKIPIPKLANIENSELWTKLVTLVSTILDLNKKLFAACDDQEKSLLARRIDSTDRQIDKMVYELYGLTAEEIAIVEGSSKAG